MPRSGTRKRVAGTQPFNGGQISPVSTYFLLDEKGAVKSNVRFFAYTDFSELSDSVRRDRLDSTRPGEIYLSLYRTTGARSNPRVSACTDGLDTDVARNGFLGFLGSAATDSGLLVDLANEFLGNLAGFAGEALASIAAFLYGIFQFLLSV